MLLVDLALVVGLVGLLVYGTIRLVTRATQPRLTAPRSGTWREAHHDVRGETHVVVEKVSFDGREVLDQHVVARIPVDDPSYDERFLAAMSQARERRALFESEDGG